MIDDTRSKPIFVQVAEQIENLILNGVLEEGHRIPSQADFAKQFSVNPLTVGKGVQLLENYGVISKRRGLGMFVLPEAKKRIYEYRKELAVVAAVDELIIEANVLHMSDEEVYKLFVQRRNGRRTKSK